MQSRSDAAGADEFVNSGQRVHAVAADAYAPTGHFAQLDEPSPDAYLPALQRTQSPMLSAPSCVEYRPASHRLQYDAPTTAEKAPALHKEHVFDADAPIAVENAPTPHAELPRVNPARMDG